MPTNNAAGDRQVGLLRRLHRRLTGSADSAWWLRASIACAIVLPTALFAVAAWNAYGNAIGNAESTALRTARTVEEHAAKVFETNELLLDQVILLLGEETSESLHAREAQLHAQLRRMVAALPQVRGLWAWDERGAPIAGSRMFPAPSVTVADREYFRVHVEGSFDTYVSELLTTRETGARIFTVSKRRTLADGRFGGVVSASLSPAYFAEFYTDLARAAPGLGVATLRGDGSFLARHPALDGATADGSAAMRADEPLRRRIAAGHTSGLYVSAAGTPGGAGLVAFRKVADYPLYAIAAVSREAVLAAWRREVMLLAAFAFPTALALAYVSWVALRRTRSEHAALRALRVAAEGRARAESALIETRRLEALGRLTGGVAHDFNNLLTVVTNNLHLQRRVAPQVADSPHLAAIGRAVETGARLTRQLLSFARSQALAPETLALQEHLPDLAPLIETTLGRGIALSLHVDGDVAPIRVDRGELELALLNLAINAKDAMPDGGHLTIAARNANDTERAAIGRDAVVMTVTDTGQGIPSEIRERVLEPFFTTKPPGKGTGLGLSQVRAFALQSGGEMTLDSIEGASTTVRIVLPASGEAVAAPSAPVRDTALSASVLFVEDNVDVAQATKALLVESGCRVQHVGTAEAAMALLGKHGARFDVVLSDVVLPGASGYELGQWLRRQGKNHLPVLLMTGYSQEGATAVAQGFAVMQKPVAPKALLDALARLVSERATARG